MSADLGLVPQDDLIEELMSRCDHGIIYLMRVGEGGPERMTYKWRWKGSPYICNGIAARIIHRVNTYLDNQEIHVPKEMT